jgi:hypothetical protein
MSVTWIEHKGKKMVFEDYSNLRGNDMLSVLYQAEAVFEKLTDPVLVLIDYSGCFTNQEFIDELKRLGKQYDDKLLKVANVGVTGIKKVIARGYLKFTGQADKVGYFDTMEEAKNYLVED